MVLPGIDNKQLSTLTHGLIAAVVSRFRGHDTILVVNVANVPYCGMLRLSGQRVALNTDGQEWLRGKWGRLARNYFKLCGRCASGAASALVSDCNEMKRIYLDDFGAPSVVIPYASHASPHAATDLRKYSVESNRFLMVAARMNPENNLDRVAEAFSRSRLAHPLLVLGTANYDSEVLTRLVALAANDPRIRLVGHVGDRVEFTGLLRAATAYVHGHSVGGMNPSLLEAMSVGARVLALDTPFNREVLADAGTYFRLDSASHAFDALESESNAISDEHRRHASHRASTVFSLEAVADAYELLLTEVAALASLRVTVPACGPNGIRVDAVCYCWPQAQTSMVLTRFFWTSQRPCALTTRSWLLCRRRDRSSPNSNAARFLASCLMTTQCANGIFIPAALASWIIRVVRSARSLFVIMRKTRFEVVYSNTLAVPLGPVLKLRFGLPHIWHAHEVLEGAPWFRPRSAWPFGTAATRWCAYRRASRSSCGRSNRPSSERASSCTTLSTSPRSRRLKLRRDLRVSLGCVGRLYPRKGHLLLLHTLALAHEQGIDADLIIFGDPLPETTYREEVLRAIDDLVLRDVVTFRGFETRAEKIYSQFDVLVLASIEPEALPLACLEAQAFGLPVIAPAEGGPVEIVVNGETGLLARPRDTASFAEAIVSLASRPDERRRMGDAGRRRAIECFSRQEFALKVNDVVAAQVRRTSSGRLKRFGIP